MRHTLAGLMPVVAFFYCSFPGRCARGVEENNFSRFVFVVVADPQIGMVAADRDQKNFAKVVEAMNALKLEAAPSIAFIAGDLVDKAWDRRQLDMFGKIRKMFAMPVHPVPGNHDMAGDGKHFERALLDNYRKVVGPDRFAIEHRGCLFVGLNSQLWVVGAGLAEEQFEWLERQLHNRDRYRYVFVIQHHPLYLGAADERDEYFNTPLGWRSKLLHLFERAKVTAVLTGHLHRSLSGNYHGVAMITTPSTSRNFDGSAFGYRLVTVSGDGFVERYVSVPGTLPDRAGRGIKRSGKRLNL
jgi:3',5'-cyclic AMP phosphodiesterase CpdA